MIIFFLFTKYIYIIVADYDPINDARGSLSRGYEPTSKPMQSTSKFLKKMIYLS
jgi:hypothetical protein